MTYEITPPIDPWSASDNGIYTVTLGGTPVTNLAGISVGTGTLGTFNVQITAAEPVGDHRRALELATGHSGRGFHRHRRDREQPGPGADRLQRDGHHRPGLRPGRRQARRPDDRPVSQGVATFSTLTLDQAGKGYTLQATSTGLPPITTGAFDVVPAAASQVVITAQPPVRVTAGLAFGLTVSVEDAYNNVVTDYSGSVKVILSTNPGSAKLGGTTTVTVSQGVATFTDLTIDKVDAGYKLQAGAPA